MGKMGQNQSDKKEAILGDEWENASGIVDMEKMLKLREIAKRFHCKAVGNGHLFLV